MVGGRKNGGKGGHGIIGGAFTSANLGHPHTVTVAWGDGTAPETLRLVDQVHGLFIGYHHYVHKGVFSITVTVRGDEGQASKTITAIVGCMDHDDDTHDKIKPKDRHHGRHKTWTCTLPPRSHHTHLPGKAHR